MEIVGHFVIEYVPGDEDSEQEYRDRVEKLLDAIQAVYGSYRYDLDYEDLRGSNARKVMVIVWAGKR